MNGKTKDKDHIPVIVYYLILFVIICTANINDVKLLLIIVKDNDICTRE